MHIFLSRALTPTLFFLSNVYAHISFASADARFFLEHTGCHGNGAQVGRGELGGTRHPPRRAADIKRIGGPYRRRKKGREEAKKKARVEERG